MEFCGGIYVKNILDIKNFMIIFVEFIGLGIYRFEVIIG